MAWRIWLFCVLVPACLPATAFSQEQQSRYARIPYDGDPASLLRQRLIQVQRLDDLVRRYSSLRERLKQTQTLPIPLPKLDGGAVDSVKQAEEMVKHLKIESQMPPDLRKELEKWKQDAVETVTSLQKPHTSSGETKPAPFNSEPAARDGEPQDRLSRWALDLLEKAEDTQVGGMIQRSPAWQKAITDLKDAIDNPRYQSGSWDLGLGKLKMSLPTGLKSALRTTWERLNNLEMPSLPKVELSAPKLGFGQSLAKLPAPRRWPVSEFIWWFGVIALSLLIGWQFLKLGAKRRSAAAARRLGPWPVHPGRINNGADLIVAFEYLAALRLGIHVRTWHHRAVADALGGATPPQRRAAGELAGLYAQARYSPEDPPLSAAALATARDDLCFLAGAVNAVAPGKLDGRVVGASGG
jgi:hypothetical protein